MDQGLLEIVGELVEARVQFFTRNLNSIMHIQRGPALQRFLGIEERYLELVDRLHRSHLRNQLVTNVITLTLGEMTQENVRVTPTQAQIDSGIMNIDTSDSNCAVCQDSITSNGFKVTSAMERPNHWNAGITGSGPPQPAQCCCSGCNGIITGSTNRRTSSGIAHLSRSRSPL